MGETSTDEAEVPDLPGSMTGESFRHFPLSIVITDPTKQDNPIVYVNRAFTRMTGYDYSSVYGRNCRFLQGEDTDEDNVERLRNAVDEGREISLDIVNYRADGSRFMNRLFVTPLRHDDDEIAFFLGIQTHHSDGESDAEKALQLTSQMRELQHRVKNHLSMVLSLIRLAAIDADSAEDVVKILGSRVEAISILYDQLAATSLGGPSEKVELGAYVSQVAGAMQNLSTSVAIRVNVHTVKAKVSADTGAKIGLILSEVLTNALQHAFEEDGTGCIDVALEETGEDALRLTVADTGRGLGDTEWPNPESLGGKIVLDLTQQLGGDLDVQSSDRGTTVTLTFAA